MYTYGLKTKCQVVQMHKVLAEDDSHPTDLGVSKLVSSQQQWHPENQHRLQ